MKKEELLMSEFLKQFKSLDELNDFVNQIHKRGLEQLLEGELDVHLGYDKHRKSELSNYRNGHTSKNFSNLHTLRDSVTLYGTVSEFSLHTYGTVSNLVILFPKKIILFPNIVIRLPKKIILFPKKIIRFPNLVILLPKKIILFPNIITLFPKKMTKEV